MKVLAAGDLHFQKDRFNSLRTMSLDCDVLCLTGDYLDDRKGDRYEQIEWVSNWVSSITKPVLMSSGNHDLDELAESEWIDKLASNIVKVDNAIWTFRGIRFGICSIYWRSIQSIFKMRYTSKSFATKQHKNFHAGW